ncbi:serine/threonine protein kinase HT1, putative [Entamoeba invadens IP1]|uniref:Serine/threonine protein kinase HT1, putative n=1 Tax=Entamoeba invadens IP1 TaxID=370355 RepID=L7FK76_ENTIV|nr:serine/threonine protein kinase HT1, putative [Entamoeba invadens IP1]ELP84822.1 serine/threonine protein kinase HT1, putative [Entamoeba invadens IP1]|eukprot:XP_004184168.1 serine/threonine protein kinase HT1, putative [Entamoeba invadens IP1]
MKRIGGKKNEKAVGDITASWSDVKKSDAIQKDGPHGDVYLCMFKQTKTVVKVLGKTNQEQFKIDAEKVKNIMHPNVILILGYCVEKSVNAIIYEPMKCNMYQAIYEKTKCPKSLQDLNMLQKMKILRDVAVGLTFIHDIKDMFHGDLKPQNILFDENGNVKVSDVYFTAFRTPTKAKKGNYFVCGDSGNLYQSPDVWTGSQPCKASDVFSFGLIVIEFLDGKASYYGNTNTQNDEAVFSYLNSKSKIIVPSQFNKSLTTMIEGCLKYETKDRIPMGKVLASFDDIIVDSTMTSTVAKKFWKECFVDGEVPLFQVAYEDFFASLGAVTDDLTDDQYNEVMEDFAKFFPETGVITAPDFDVTVNWFGNYFDDKEIFTEVSKIATAKFFAGLIDKKRAEGMLTGKVDGTYLVRASTTDPKKYPFTITRNANGSVKHHRIERLAYGAQVEKKFTSTIDKKTFTAKNLFELLNKMKEFNIITTEDDGKEVSAYGDM